MLDGADWITTSGGPVWGGPVGGIGDFIFQKLKHFESCDVKLWASFVVYSAVQSFSPIMFPYFVQKLLLVC